MKKQHSMVTLGITSLFLIFAVLCMVILSLLTLGSSRSDLRMSMRSMEQTTAYYDACTTASNLCLQAEDFLKEIRTQTTDRTEYLKQAAGLEEQGFTWDPELHILSFEVDFSDTQTLHVEAEALFPDSSDGPFLTLCTWQTCSIGTWTPDTSQTLYQP